MTTPKTKDCDECGMEYTEDNCPTCEAKESQDLADYKNMQLNDEHSRVKHNIRR